jgi:2-(1,2-epoxy-1,2-dihydrophenyl)acetyl-CoA isomerase
VLTLNNPRRLNAFNWAMRSSMYARLLEIEANPDCLGLLLTGAGGNLCAGGDISEMQHREVIEARVRVDLATRIFRLLVNGPEPFVCAVEGNAAGAGISRGFRRSGPSLHGKTQARLQRALTAGSVG